MVLLGEVLSRMARPPWSSLLLVGHEARWVQRHHWQRPSEFDALALTGRRGFTDPTAGTEHTAGWLAVRDGVITESPILQGLERLIDDEVTATVSWGLLRVMLDGLGVSPLEWWGLGGR